MNAKWLSKIRNIDFTISKYVDDFVCVELRWRQKQLLKHINSGCIHTGTVCSTLNEHWSTSTDRMDCLEHCERSLNSDALENLGSQLTCK